VLGASERASPAAAKDVHLAVDMELTAEPQHVIDQMRGRVVGECRRSVVVACARCALATAALVEKNDPVSLRIVPQPDEVLNRASEREVEPLKGAISSLVLTTIVKLRP
jgi:hypothetical protein